MIIKILLVALAMSALVLFLFNKPSITKVEQPINANGVTEDDIIRCEKDSDCIIVPYRDCCGSTKKAINRKFKSLYFSKPEWQKFDNPQTCSVIGVCPNDREIKVVLCNGDSPYKNCSTSQY